MRRATDPRSPFLLPVARDRRVRDLVGLLHGVRHDRPHRLLAVPRAVAPEPLGQFLELEEGVGELLALGAQPVVGFSWVVGL